ncbi:MAG: hypothetical protein Q9M27_06415, partial [Mariprofundaceae bacterium]|nr:hypothetical protein [Mariprofundaceae bacterium]
MRSGMPFPDQELIVCGHGVILEKGQAMIVGQLVDGFKIPDTAQRVLLPEMLIEAFIALAGKGVLIPERPVHTQNASGLKG